MQDVFVARQAVFDRALKVFGYELLFRSTEQAKAATFTDGESATAEVLLNAFTIIGLDEVVGSHRAFINMPRRFLLQQTIPLPAERVVLEVLEHEEADQPLSDALSHWSREGYLIALDDYVISDPRAPLVPQVNIVKVEISGLSERQLEQHVHALRQHKVALLAEKVETPEQFEVCYGLGFDYFQGYFLQQPKVMQAVSIATSHGPTLMLLAALYRSDIELDEIEGIIAQEVSLSYKLLRYLNSALFPVRRKFDTIRQALIYLGLEELRSWAALIVLSAVSGKPRELIAILATRAKMCELVAESLRLPSPKSYFTIGLFSGLDALLDAPLAEILEQLALEDELVAAILERSGEGGRILSTVLHYERGAWEQLEQARLPSKTLITAYLGGLRWAKLVALTN